MVVANRRRTGVGNSPRRQVRFINGDISIQKPLSSDLPTLLPRGFESTYPAPVTKKPFAPFTASAPPQSVTSTPFNTAKSLFQNPNPSPAPISGRIKPHTSFADLFKRPSPPSTSDKGILPLPPASNLLENQGWTKVVYKKRAPNPRSQQLSHPPSSTRPKRCFLCGDLYHMAKNCKLGAVRCFKCKKTGHSSLSCPSLQGHPSVCPYAQPPPPIIPTSSAVRERILKLSSFGILTLGMGSPSIPEIKEMLEYRFNIKDWSYKILRASDKSYYIEFPSDELRDRAVLMGYVDMGSFGGTFSRWTEAKGMQVFPKPELFWIKLVGLPLHLWEGDFITELLKEWGEVYACSRSIMHMEEIEDCRVLLKAKSRKDIPSSLKFRYVSPINNWLMEGNVTISFHGKPISEEDIKSDRGAQYLMREGDSTTQFSWKDLMGLALDWESEIRRPLSSDIAPDEPISEGQQHQIDLKGKGVIGQSSNLEGRDSLGADSPLRAQPVNPTYNDPVTNYPDMVEVIVEGNSVFLPRDKWAAFYSDLKQGPQIDSVREPGIPIPSSPQISPISTDAISSTQPPGFERRRSMRRRRRAPISLCHKPYRRFLAGTSKPIHNQGKKGQSSSTSTPFLPINALSDASLSSIAANCGVIEPLPSEVIKDIKALEVDRARLIS